MFIQIGLTPVSKQIDEYETIFDKRMRLMQIFI